MEVESIFGITMSATQPQLREERKLRNVAIPPSPRKMLMRLPSLITYFSHPSRLLQMGTARWLKLKYMSSGILIIMFTFFMLSFTINDTVQGVMAPVASLISDVRGEALPRGFMEITSDLALRPLDNKIEAKIQAEMPRNLLAMAVGIEQKTIVDQIIQKFPLRNFTIMLFHYDGVVEEWNDLPWSNRSIHIVASHQTKWWFAKRFLHPDIVEEYNYIFLWDEDLGVEHFDPVRYLKIMKEEGLEITQPALDPLSPEIHHKFTRRHPDKRVHRRFIKKKGSFMCTESSTGPPCTGWVEVMAPVFSKAAWRCTWHMIQNDLVHGWGLDLKLGYCAQGIRSEKVGVIDDEYVVHLGIPTSRAASGSRGEVRKQSHEEILVFAQRWKEAVKSDSTWVDPYPSSTAENFPLPMV